MKSKYVIFISFLLLIISCNKKNSYNTRIDEEYNKFFNLALGYEQKSIEFFKSGDLKSAEINSLKFKDNIFLAKKYYQNSNKKREENYLGLFLTGAPMTILGFIYYDRGDYEAAAEHFKRAFGNNFITLGSGYGEWYFYLLSLIKANKVMENKMILDNVVKAKYVDYDIRMPIFYYIYAKYLLESNQSDLLKDALATLDEGIKNYQANLNGYKNLVTDSKGYSHYDIIPIDEFSFEPDVKADILKQFKLNVSLDEMEALKKQIVEKMNSDVQ